MTDWPNISNSNYIHMVFDLDLIKKIYAAMPGKIAAARQTVGKPLTLTEKILYTHLHGALPPTPYTRG
jgi:aconitate hydratase